MTKKIPSNRPFRKVSELFKNPEAIVEALNAAGFKAELLSSVEHWSDLQYARSAGLESPAPQNFTYVGPEFRGPLNSGWGLVIADKKVAAKLQAQGLPVLSVIFPDAAMDFILKKISPEEWTGPSAAVPSGVRAESSVHIGPDCDIGAGTILEHGVRLGARVTIGKNCRIGAQSRIADDSVLGDDCVLTGSVSIGGPGFGFVYYPGTRARVQRQHVGRVLIGDRVRVGAFAAIDRGVFEDTRLGADVAVDNLVQIAHNCEVGDNSTLCGFVGLTGSTTLGKNVTLAGMVFTKGHLSIGDNVTVAGWSGITSDVAANQVLKGYPVKKIQDALKQQVLQDKLPEFYDRLKKLEKKLGE